VNQAVHSTELNNAPIMMTGGRALGEMLKLHEVGAMLAWVVSSFCRFMTPAAFWV
jgi:hypothetical protein